MFTPLKVACALFVAIGMIVISSLAVTTTSFAAAPQAAQAQQTNDIPLEIIPECSDATGMISKWQVNNKNSYSITIGWDNFVNNLTGNYSATPGLSQLVTGYNPADPNNTTTFMYSGNTSTTNAQVSACAPVVVPVQPSPTCIDGHIQQNLSYTWVTNNTVSVKTFNNAPLCDNVTLFFSSYTMPDNYDGSGFYGNLTATPQTKFDSATQTLLKGTDGTSSFTIQLPDSCKNTQVDLYYGPEILTVDANGHGTQNIVSNVYLSNGSCTTNNSGAGSTKQPPVTPQQPVVTTPVVTTNPGKGAAGGEEATAAAVTTSAVSPTELPETGPNAFKSALTAILFGVLTYGVLYLAIPKQEVE